MGLSLIDALPWLGLYCAIGIVVWFVARWFVPDQDVVIFIGGLWLPVIVLGIPVVVLMVSFLGIGWLSHHLDEWIAFHFLKRLIQEDKCGQLWRARGPHEPFQWVRVQDSTGVYWIPVNPEVQTAQAAVAWTYQVSEYSPTMRA